MKNYTPRANRYPNGYLPKIEYYQAFLANAVTDLDIKKIKFYAVKLEYFLNRQAEVEARLEKLY